MSLSSEAESKDKISVRFYFNSDGVKPTIWNQQKMLCYFIYDAVKSRNFAPVQILIRSILHDGTTTNGFADYDPNGMHYTISFKQADQVERRTHYTCHVYTTAPLKLDKTRFLPEPPRERLDSTMKPDGGPVWPEDESELWDLDREGGCLMCKK